MSSQQVPESLVPVATSTPNKRVQLPKVTDEKNELRMWSNDYNGTVYLHIQQKFEEPEKKKRSYCFLTSENVDEMYAILVHALRKPKDFEEKLVGTRENSKRLLQLIFKRNSDPKNTAYLYVYEPSDVLCHSCVTIVDVEAFQKCFNEIYSEMYAAAS